MSGFVKIAHQEVEEQLKLTTSSHFCIVRITLRSIKDWDTRECVGVVSLSQLAG